MAVEIRTRLGEIHKQLSKVILDPHKYNHLSEEDVSVQTTWLHSTTLAMKYLSDPKSFLSSPDYLLRWCSDVKTSRGQFNDLRKAMQKLIHDFMYMVCS